MKVRLALVNVTNGATIAMLEMDEEMMMPDAGIIDPKSCSLRSFKNGGVHTLVPMEDHTVTLLEKVRHAYKSIVEKPLPRLNLAFDRVDHMLDMVALLFGEISYIAVSTRDDIDKLINPPPDGSWEPTLVKYKPIDDLIEKAIDKSTPELPLKPVPDDAE